ncbi:MAG: hypothetical protein ACOYMS_13390 [Terrimicrobiaceae bacterium]
MIKQVLLLLALGITGCAAPKPAGSPADPRQTAQVFYDTLRANQVRGLPEGKAWRELQPLLTPELAAHFRDAEKIQAVFIRKNPSEKPPWCEGDLFSSLFEGPQSHIIGVARIQGDRAEVPVKLLHADPSGSARWTDTLILRQTARGWLVDDVIYGGNWPFAPKGSLVEALTSEGC